MRGVTEAGVFEAALAKGSLTGSKGFTKPSICPFGGPRTRRVFTEGLTETRPLRRRGGATAGCERLESLEKSEGSRKAASFRESAQGVTRMGGATLGVDGRMGA